MGYEIARALKPKSLGTAGLLLFVAVSVGTLIVKERSSRPTPTVASVGLPDSPTATPSTPRVIAYYFHGQARCVTCKTIEAYAREAIDTYFSHAVKSGQLEVRSVNFEEPENEHFLDDYQLTSSSLVLVDARDSGPASWKLLQEVWQLTADKPAFLGYVKQELGRFLDTHGG